MKPGELRRLPKIASIVGQFRCIFVQAAGTAATASGVDAHPSNKLQLDPCRRFPKQVWIWVEAGLI